MKIKSLFCQSVMIVIVLFLTQQSFAGIYPRTDTLFIPQTQDIPSIDAMIDDHIWDQAEWNPIDQVWMPWNNEAANLDQENGLELYDGADDFTGNFKVLWSQETNLLYFLVEVTDDIFVDGYVYPNGGYPNYDIVEVFIDEDRSGGLHVFDGTGNVAQDWGTNAENAFSYHIAPSTPQEGIVQNNMHVLDIAGTSWGDNYIADYASHLPEFALLKTGNSYVWEFSMIVHDDSYDPNDPENSVVTIKEGKIMGLSLAYCDNDDPTQIQREHFFGSVEVPLANHNDHWKQADFYGVAKLAPSGSVSANPDLEDISDNMHVHLNNNRLVLSYTSGENGNTLVRIIDVLGKEVHNSSHQKQTKTIHREIPTDNLYPGIYILHVFDGRRNSSLKILIP